MSTKFTKKVAKGKKSARPTSGADAYESPTIDRPPRGDDEGKKKPRVKIYVASSWRNERQQHVVAQLRRRGHEVYDFKNPPQGTGSSWRKVLPDPVPWSAEKTREVLAHPVSQAGFDSDFDAMKWADAIVMVQPCGRSAALELGWGCGAGKITIALLADGQEPELMLKCADLIATSLDEVLAHLESRKAGA